MGREGVGRRGEGENIDFYCIYIIGNMVPDEGYFNFSLDFVPDYNSSLPDTCPVSAEKCVLSHSIVVLLLCPC